MKEGGPYAICRVQSAVHMHTFDLTRRLYGGYPQQLNDTTTLGGNGMPMHGVACGSGASPAPTSTTTVAGETRLTGSVALFLPNDGFTVSQDVPLNSWHDFADATKDSLEDRGFEADHVQTHADSDLERQSHRIQDYVVDALDGSTDGSSADPEAQSTTLVVAPAAPMTDTVKRYGDYVTQSLAQGTGADEDATDESLDESLSRMTRALGLAKKAGMHVVVVATPLPGFTPDAFVSLCSAREIGRLQARQLVSKPVQPQVHRDPAAL